jgi:hypothetical protein
MVDWFECRKDWTPMNILYLQSTGDNLAETNMPAADSKFSRKFGFNVDITWAPFLNERIYREIFNVDVQ